MSFLEIGYSRISSTIYLQFGYDIIRKEDDDDEISKTIYKGYTGTTSRTKVCKGCDKIKLK